MIALMTMKLKRIEIGESIVVDEDMGAAQCLWLALRLWRTRGSYDKEKFHSGHRITRIA